MFVCIQLYAWIFNPSFFESTEAFYLERDANVMYEVPTRNFLPTIAVCDNYSDAQLGNTANCNNMEHWVIYFTQTTLTGARKKIDAVNCVDLIESWTDLPAPERNAIHDELLFEELLCPNITTIHLEGN